MNGVRHWRRVGDAFGADGDGVRFPKWLEKPVVQPANPARQPAGQRRLRVAPPFARERTAPRRWVPRAKPQRTLRPVNGALSLPGVSQHNGTKEEREGGRRTESKRALERFP